MTTGTRSRCVRCGRRARHADMYVCLACHESPALRSEMAAASRRFRTWEAQRGYLVAHGWAGGWPSRRSWERDT